MPVEGVVFAQSYSSKLGIISIRAQVGNTFAWYAVNPGSSLGQGDNPSDSDDHYCGGPMSLGPIPSGT